MKKRLLLLSALLVMVSALVVGASAQDAAWPDPDETITVVVPFSAGGGTDLIFRAFVDEMDRHTEATIVVDNIPGAGSATGTNEVLNLPADGYTLLASGAHTVTATLQGLTDGFHELEGIVGLNWDPFVVAVHRDNPWETFEDVVAAAEENPGAISFGNAGMGGATGVLTVGLNLHFDNIFNVVPFDGGADLLANVLGRHADVGVFSQSEMVAQLEELRPLMFMYTERSRIPELEDVPTFEEAGYPDLNVPFGSYRSVSVRAGTPPEAKEALADMATQAFESERFQDFMVEHGLLPAYSELDELDAYFGELEEMFTPILEAADLLAE